MPVCSISFNNVRNFIKKESCLLIVVLSAIALAILTRIAWHDPQYRGQRGQMLRFTILTGALVPLTLICRCFSKNCCKNSSNQTSTTRKSPYKGNEVRNDKAKEVRNDKNKKLMYASRDGFFKLHNDLFKETEDVTILLLYNCNFEDLHIRLYDIMGGHQSTLRSTVIINPQSFDVNFFESAPVSLKSIVFIIQDPKLINEVKMILSSQGFASVEASAEELRSGVTNNANTLRLQRM